jgi:hypothetical protein
MSHPHNEHRAHRHEKSRVAHLTEKHAEPKHYARGGKVHGDEAEDKELIRKEVKGEALKHEGKKPKMRADKAMRRAKGGKVHGKGHGKTNVNVIVAPGGGKPMAGLGGGMPPGPPPPMAAPPMPPKPPMAAPSPAPGAMAGPSPLGGMPPRRAGGRAYKRGGKVNKDFGHADMSPAHPQSHEDDWGYGKPRASGGKVEGKKSLADKVGVTGIGTRTPIQHSGNKSDTQNIGRGKTITYATGGPVEAQGAKGKQMAPHIGAGNNGIGRLKKAHMGSATGMKP